MLKILDKKLTMTSREVVDLINRFRKEEDNRAVLQHKDFMKSIRKEIETLEKFDIKIGERNISLSSYSDGSREYTEYVLNKKAIMQMLNKESALVRYRTQVYI